MIKFEFFVPGLPMPTQYKQTKFGVIYNVGRAVAWRKAVTQMATISAGAGYKPLSGMVSLSLDFYFPIPKSRKDLKPGMAHLQDPDCSNILKNTEDGLKRVLFTDDCMVANLGVSKQWIEAGKEGVQVVVTIEEA
jgi:Holliday junction resolvase RusA-like endonuclease